MCCLILCLWIQTLEPFYELLAAPAQLISIFFPLAMIQWNALSEFAVSWPSFDIFKEEIGKLQHIKPIVLFNLSTFIPISVIPYHLLHIF